MIATTRGAYAGKGDALFFLKRYDEAIVFLKKSLSLEPDMPQASLIQVLIAEAAQKLGRFEEAETHYRLALHIEPGLQRAHAGLIGLLIEQERPGDLERHSQAVRWQYADDPVLLQGIAEAFRKQKRYAEALEWYAAVFEADPDYTQAHAGRGDALFHLERYEEAIESIKRAISLEPEMATVPALRTLMGEAMQALGQTEAAAEQFERALQDDPRSANAIDRLAMLRYGQGRYGEALELYRTHIDISPDNANAHTNLGIVLYKMGRLDESRKILEHALSLDPTAGRTRTMLELIRTGS